MKMSKNSKIKSESDIIFEDMSESTKSTKVIPMKTQLKKAIETPKCKFPMDLING